MADDGPHRFYVEVTVAASIVGPDGKALGGDMGSMTVGFVTDMDGPQPVDLTQRDIPETIAGGMHLPIHAAARAMVDLGYQVVGRVETAMIERSANTGKHINLGGMVVDHPTGRSTTPPRYDA